MGVDLNIAFGSCDDISAVLEEFECPDPFQLSGMERYDLLGKYVMYLYKSLAPIEGYEVPLKEGDACFPSRRLSDASEILEIMGYRVLHGSFFDRRMYPADGTQRRFATIFSFLSPILFLNTYPVWNPHQIHNLSLLPPTMCSTLSAQIRHVDFSKLAPWFSTIDPEDGDDVSCSMTSIDDLERLCRWFDGALSIAGSTQRFLIASVM